MTLAQVIDLLRDVGEILTAIGVLVSMLKSSRNGRILGESRELMQTLVVNVNGRMEKLMALAAGENQAIGRAAERADAATEAATAHADRMAEAAAAKPAPAPAPSP